MKYWTTKEGIDIPYKKIKDDHLINILKFVKRRAKEGILSGFCSYEGDDDFMTGDIWQLTEKEALEMLGYKGLLREAKKRKLLN